MMGLPRLAMLGRIPSVINVPVLLRSPSGQAAGSLAVGFLVAILAYVVLHSLPTAERVPEPTGPPVQEPARPLVAEDSLSRLISPGNVGVTVPVGALEPVSNSVAPGDRFDVIALVPSSGDTPYAAVVVRGAILRGRPGQSSGGGPLLLEVEPDEAIVLGHLMQGGVRLSYALWPANGSPPAIPPMELGALRDLLREEIGAASPPS